MQGTNRQRLTRNDAEENHPHYQLGYWAVGGYKILSKLGQYKYKVQKKFIIPPYIIYIYALFIHIYIYIYIIICNCRKDKNEWRNILFIKNRQGKNISQKNIKNRLWKCEANISIEFLSFSKTIENTYVIWVIWFNNHWSNVIKVNHGVAKLLSWVPIKFSISYMTKQIIKVKIKLSIHFNAACY